MKLAAFPAHPWREATISALINGGLSTAIYIALFAGLPAVPVWTWGGYVFDFVPQGFMVALMGSLVPGLQANSRQAQLGRPALPSASILRDSIRVALVASILSAGIAATVLALNGMSEIGFHAGLAIKIVFALALSLIVTPRMIAKVRA